MTRILNGVTIARAIRAEIAGEVADFERSTGAKPKLAAVLLGDDPASHVYVEHKRRGCTEVGMDSEIVALPAATTADELLDCIRRLNADPAVSGILVQLPLPDHLSLSTALDAVAAEKDVDCFHPINVGLLAQGRPRFLPCTPHGVIQILYRSGIPTSGKHVCILGRSEIVGRPLAAMLSHKSSALGPEWCNATVTLLHSRSRDIPQWTRLADIVVAAIGKPCFLTRDMVKAGAVVIDVGINRLAPTQGQARGKLVGDVDYQSLLGHAGAITPVPGGVGPLTVTMLLANTLAAARFQSQLVAAD